MVILGINAFHADASAAIYVDGKLVAGIEEERFRRVKHFAGFPSEAIRFCLHEAGVPLAEVDEIAIGRDPNAKRWKKLGFLMRQPFAATQLLSQRWKNKGAVTSIAQLLANEFTQGNLSEVPKVNFVEHHRSHLASAFYPSAFSEAAILSIDGSGDFSTTMTAVGRGNDIKVLNSVDYPHSLGLFYTAFTQLLGFPHYGDEYKVMGLAAYGQPDDGMMRELLKVIITDDDSGLFKLQMDYFMPAIKGYVQYDEFVPRVSQIFGDEMVGVFGPQRRKDEPVSKYHMNLAASVQATTEKVIFHLATHLYHKTGLDALCIAGGVGQNSVANGKILKGTPFKKLYIPSAAHDAGISMGAALYVQHQLKRLATRVHQVSAHTGTRYSNEQIIEVLDKRKISYTFYDDNDLFDVVSDQLINAGVVGWFTGRAEFGPRALGGRSILADPRRKDAKDLINQKIKRREGFRPFAPSVLADYVSDFFETDVSVPFMEQVYPVKEEVRLQIPAVTHVDGSARLQTVDASVNSRYYRLIDTFRQKTGVAILLNTSFNENEPIVNTPEEALNCFLRTEMDMLVLENCVITR